MRKRYAALILMGVLLWAACGAFAENARQVIPSATAFKLTLGDSRQLTAFVKPSEADQRIVWKSANPAIAAVDMNGLVSSKALGRTTVQAISFASPGIKAEVKVKVIKGVTPTRVVLGMEKVNLKPGETLQLSPAVLPAGASQMVKCVSLSPEIATVTTDGLITAKANGTATIRVRSQTKTSIRTTLTVEVFDPLTPSSIVINDSGFMEKGESRRLDYTVKPDTALKDVTWSSSAPGVVYVSSDGVMRALSGGQATITCTAKRGGLAVQLEVAVVSGKRTTAVPQRITSRDASAVSKNLSLMDDIYHSALSQLDTLEGKDLIDRAEYGKRQAILVNAFAMYRFPWYTNTPVRYWSTKYSMGGKKDFKPGNVYYGLPYIQYGAGNNRLNRRYNVDRALKGGYFAKAENELYVMTDKRMSKMYVGNDCSAFCNMAVLPANGTPAHSALCAMITRTMLKNSAYTKLTGYDALRPGDLLCKSGHTLMFLYYTNAAKTRMMVIEQGGGTTTDIHNTVCCSVVNRSSYEGKYKPLRASFLAK